MKSNCKLKVSTTSFPGLADVAIDHTGDWCHTEDNETFAESIVSVYNTICKISIVGLYDRSNQVEASILETKV